MFKIGQIAVYRREVCTLVAIDRKYQNDEDYYVLVPVDNNTLTIRLPISHAKGVLRPLITKAEVEDLIGRIPDIETVAINSWSHASEYRDLLSSSSHEDLIRIIKTAYLRQQDRTDKHQKVNENDKVYYRTAEKLLYSEIAAVLKLTYEEARDFVVTRVSALATPEVV